MPKIMVVEKMWSPLPLRPNEDVVAAAATMSICCSDIKIRYRSNNEINVAILAVHIDQLVSQSLHTAAKREGINDSMY